MPKTDAHEAELQAAFDKGALKSVASKAKLVTIEVAARATPLKDKRANARTLAAVKAAKSGRATSVLPGDL